MLELQGLLSFYKKLCHSTVYGSGHYLFGGGGIGITADPGENSYDPPLNDLLKPVEIPMTPPNSIYEYNIRDIHCVNIFYIP